MINSDNLPRVMEMYQEVSEILAKYLSGKVAKAFKVIAQFRSLEDLLILTNWSDAAVYQTTRIFTANLASVCPILHEYMTDTHVHYVLKCCK